MVHLISKPKSDTNFFLYTTSNGIAPQYMDMMARMPQYLVLFWPIGRVNMRDASGLPWMLLMKLGRKEHMEQFRTGLLYMNALSYFQSLEADMARGDRY